MSKTSAKRSLQLIEEGFFNLDRRSEPIFRDICNILEYLDREIRFLKKEIELLKQTNSHD